MKKNFKNRGHNCTYSLQINIIEKIDELFYARAANKEHASRSMIVAQAINLLHKQELSPEK